MAKFLNNDEGPIVSRDPWPPNSAEAWDLELAAQEAAGRTDVPDDVRKLVDELWEEVEARGIWHTPNSQSKEPLTPDSPEEWDLETRTFHSVDRDGVPKDVDHLIRLLWAEACFRQKWLAST